MSKSKSLLAVASLIVLFFIFFNEFHLGFVGAWLEDLVKLVD
jgi:hypothetical protein